jgi:hypothetical protein
MTSSAALSALSPDQLLPLLRERQGAWRQRDQLQRIGLYSFGEACGYGSTGRNQATATLQHVGTPRLGVQSLARRHYGW